MNPCSAVEGGQHWSAPAEKMLGWVASKPVAIPQTVFILATFCQKKTKQDLIIL